MIPSSAPNTATLNLFLPRGLMRSRYFSRFPPNWRMMTLRMRRYTTLPAGFHSLFLGGYERAKVKKVFKLMDGKNPTLQHLKYYTSQVTVKTTTFSEKAVSTIPESRRSATAAQVSALMANDVESRPKKPVPVQFTNESEASNSVGSYTVVQPDSPFSIQEMDLSGYCCLGPSTDAKDDSSSSCSVKNYSLTQEKSSVPVNSQFSGDSDSDFTDINAFTQILRRG